MNSSELSTAKKILLIVVVCCIAAVVVGVIGGFLLPDSNTDDEVPTDAVYLNITAEGYDAHILYENETHYGEKNATFTGNTVGNHIVDLTNDTSTTFDITIKKTAGDSLTARLYINGKVVKEASAENGVIKMTY